jgi:signal peptidase I
MKFKLITLALVLLMTNMQLRHECVNPEPSKSFMSDIFYMFPDTYSFIVPDTHSMEPALSAGDKVYIDRRADYDDLIIGDVIVYSPKELRKLRDEGKTTAHSLIHRIEHYLLNDETGVTFTIKGDNNPRRDKFRMTRDNYIGKMVKVEFDSMTVDETHRLYKSHEYKEAVE